jgi:hypothetical protein
MDAIHGVQQGTASLKVPRGPCRREGAVTAPMRSGSPAHQGGRHRRDAFTAPG